MRVMVLILALLAAFRITTASAEPGPATLLADGWRQYKERFVTSDGRVVDNANARDYRGLLRTRCKRPSRHCAAEKRDEPAALHIRPSGEGIVTAQTRTWIGVQTPIKRISVGAR